VTVAMRFREILALPRVSGETTPSGPLNFLPPPSRGASEKICENRAFAIAFDRKSRMSVASALPIFLITSFI